MASQAVLELLIQLKDQASAGLSSLGGALSSIGGIAGGVALGGIVALGAGIASGIGDAREAALIMAQTEAVIKSTGGAADVSAQQVADYAGSLSAAAGQSLFGDSQIQESTNLLLTFTNIKAKTLEAATAISVDMAQAMGGAPKDAAIQLGKALNDPIAGITALSRVGVSFTDEQKEQIRVMQEAGDIAGAQAIILAELNKEFGGSAKAAADADGGWTQFNDRMGELWESIGAKLLPILTQFAGFLNDTLMPLIEGNVGPGMASLQPILDQVGVAVGQLGTWFMTSLLPAVQAAGLYFQTEIMPILNDLGTALMPLVNAAIALLAQYWSTILLPALMIVGGFLKDNVIPVVADVARWLRDELPPAIEKTSDFFNTKVLPAITAVAGFITGTVIPAFGTLFTWLGDVATKAQELATAFSRDLQAGIALVSGLVTDTLKPALEGLGSISTSVAGWFGDISNAIKGAVDWIQTLVDKLSSVKIPDWLEGHSPPPMADWFKYIADSAQAVTTQVASLDRALSSAIPNAANSIGVGSSQGQRSSNAGGGLGRGSGGRDVEVHVTVDDKSDLLRNAIKVVARNESNDIARNAFARSIT